MPTYAQLTAPDKLMHALSGVVLFATLNLFMPGAYALLLTTFTGFMKELYDSLHRKKHTPELLDALCTCAGGLLGFGCTF